MSDSIGGMQPAEEVEFELRDHKTGKVEYVLDKLERPTDSGKQYLSELSKAELDDTINDFFSDPAISNRAKTYDEFKWYRQNEQNKPITEKVSDFFSKAGEVIPSALYGLGKDVNDAIYATVTKPLFDPKTYGQLGASTGAGIGRATTDLWMNMGQNVIGQIIDKQGRRAGRSEEWEIEREYERYLNNHIWQQDRRTNFEKLVKDTSWESWIDDDISKGGELLEPVGAILPIGKAGTLAQKGFKEITKKAATAKYVSPRAMSRGLKKTAGFVQGKSIGARDWFNDFMAENAGQEVAGVTNVISNMGFGAVDKFSTIAKAGAATAEDMFIALGQPSGRKRFLQRLAKSDSLLMKTPGLKRKLAQAHDITDGWVGDRLFGSAVNSASTAAIETALMGLSGSTASEIGEQAGAGFVGGGAMGLVSPFATRGAGDDLSMGSMVDGEFVPSPRTQIEIGDLISRISDEQQVKAFQQLPKGSQALISILDSSGLTQGVRTRFLDEATFDDVFTEAKLRGKFGVSKELSPSDRDAFRETYKKQAKKIAPSSWYDGETNTVYVRSDSKSGKSMKELNDVLLKQMSKPLIHNLVKNDEFMARKILQPFIKSDFLREEGTTYKLGDNSILLDSKLDKFVEDYNSKNRGKIETAQDLASALMTEQFGMMFSKDPTSVERLGGPGSVLLHDITTNLLDRVGIKQDTAGKILSNPVSDELQKIPHIQNLIRNQVKLAKKSSDYLLELSEMPQEIIPRDKAQSTADAFDEAFSQGGVDASKIPLEDTLKFIDATRREVTKNISVRDTDNVRYAGYSLREKTEQMNRDGIVPAGMELSPEMKQALIDELGAGNEVMNQVEMIESAIREGRYVTLSHLKEKQTWEKSGSLKKGIKTFESLKGHKHYKNKHGKADVLTGVPTGLFFNKKMDLLVQLWEKKKQDANVDAIIAYNMRKGLGKITSRKDFQDRVDALRQRIIEQKGNETKKFKDQYKIDDEWVIAALFPGRRTDKDGASFWKDDDVRKMMDEISLKPAFRSVRFDRVQNKTVPRKDNAPIGYYPNVRDVY